MEWRERTLELAQKPGGFLSADKGRSRREEEEFAGEAGGLEGEGAIEEAVCVVSEMQNETEGDLAL
jgi:hypothetical protein